MASKAPGKSFREGLTLIQVMDMFPDEAAATAWFESIVWPTGRCCGKCGATNTREVPKEKPMPYWCPDCRSYFSVRTGTAMSHTRIPLRKWAIAIYVELTSLKGISSMKLHRDIGVSQPTAWFMLHRIREAWGGGDGGPKFSGPVEVDETYMGGKRKNMSNAKRASLEGRGAVGKTTVAGAKDRATNRDKRPRGSRNGQCHPPGLRRRARGPWGDRVHRRARLLPGDALRSRGGQAWRRRVRPGPSAHQRGRELLGNAQARPYRNVP